MAERIPTNNQVERRAYEMFLERGCEHGHALEDWVAAEKELTGRRDEIEAVFRQEQLETKPQPQRAPRPLAATAGRKK